MFDRKRQRNIAVYAVEGEAGARAAASTTKTTCDYDVLDYDIDVAVAPDGSGSTAAPRMRLKVRASALGQLTLRLADSLVVHSIVSDEFGRLFSLRVTNQNTLLVNLPARWCATAS